MSYEKQTWQTGDVVTSAKLNHMEDGIAAAGGGGVLVVNVTFDESTETEICDKTAGEMTAALESGGIIFRQYDEGDGVYYYSTLKTAGISDEEYYFESQGTQYSASSASEYPSTGGGPK